MNIPPGPLVLEMPPSPPSKGSKHRGWLSSYPSVAKWMRRYDLGLLLDANGGFVRLLEFFPEFVAAGILSELEAIPSSDWVETAAANDATSNNIQHFFHSVKHHAIVDMVARALSLLHSHAFSYTFSAARYCQGHSIVPHDDRAYADVMVDGKLAVGSREIAIVYYLTREWSPSLGGSLRDLASNKTYTPEFNSLVAFTVPRLHEVMPVTGPRPRFSIFGWFLAEGKSYELNLGEKRGPRLPETGQSKRKEVSEASGSYGSARVEELDKNKRRRKSQVAGSRPVELAGRHGEFYVEDGVE